MIRALALLALAPAAVAQFITVDAAGGADYLTIGAAVQAAPPGAVLLVAPGDYPAFELDKELTILGQGLGSRPVVDGTSRVIGAPAFRLARLTFDRLVVQDVPGRGSIDTCLLGLDQSPLEIVRSLQVLVERTSVLCGPWFVPLAPTRALYAEDSNVVVIGCFLAANAGGPQEGAAVEALRGGIMLVRTDALGGCGESAGAAGAPGIRAKECVLALRGSGNTVEGGCGAAFGPDGPSVAATASTLTTSGYAFPEGFALVDTPVTTPPFGEPFLTLPSFA